MRDYNKNPDDLFPQIPDELAGAHIDVHAEFRRIASIAAEATARARKVVAAGAQPELTEEESFAIAYVAGLRPTLGLMIQGKIQMNMPEFRLGWDHENGRFIVEAKQ